MNEAEAQEWLRANHGARALEQLARYAAMLLRANEQQNLISKSTEASIWQRHILDSAQLLQFAPGANSWLDVGSGAGLPGIVLAVLTPAPVYLVEPRRKRAEFLQETVDLLGLSNVILRHAEVERISGGPFAAVTARAYARLSKIFSTIAPLADRATAWVLPKGRSVLDELAEAERLWQGVFHVEHSMTHGDARIIVARDVQMRRP